MFFIKEINPAFDQILNWDEAGILYEEPYMIYLSIMFGSKLEKEPKVTVRREKNIMEKSLQTV